MPPDSAPPKTHAQTVRLAVSPEHAGLRLDRFLASQLPEMSRTRIQTLVEQGRVLVDGLARKASLHVEPGATVVIEIPPPAAPVTQPENIPLEILYEDDALIAVNKPAGMVVHPGAGGEKGTLVATLLHHFGGTEGLSTIGAPLRPGIVHRLDKGTSGVVVVARTDAAHWNLAEQFRSREVEKTYLALLHGKLKGDSGRIDLPVARDLRRRTRMTSRRSEGREARTDWRVRLRMNIFSLIEADLHTGRTHQIRVHFSALGCPVVGDTLYGAPRQERLDSDSLPALDRNFLHAWRIRFAHPRTGKPLEIRAPLPEELRAYLETLGGATQTASRAIDAALQGFL